MNEEFEIVAERQHSGQPMSVENDYLVEVAESADRRIQAVKKIKAIVLQLTNANDWTDQGGKPYLTASGSHKVASMFGVSWRFIREPKKVVDEDGHYRYEVPLELTSGRRTIEVIGSRSSRDPFFCTRYRDGQRMDLPPSEVDGGDVLKAAITNAQGVGISALLGIRNLTWEDLGHSGITRDQTSRVEYAKAEMSADAQELRSEIRRMILEMAGNDATRAQVLLSEHTSFVGRDGKTIPGKRNVNDLSEKAIPVTYGKVKPVYEKWLAEQQPETPAEEPKAGRANEPLV